MGTSVSLVDVKFSKLQIGLEELRTIMNSHQRLLYRGGQRVSVKLGEGEVSGAIVESIVNVDQVSCNRFKILGDAYLLQEILRKTTGTFEATTVYEAGTRYTWSYVDGRETKSAT